RREPGDQGRLAGPEPRRAGPFDREQRKRLPRLPDEREQPVADGLYDEAAAERRPGADAVDHGTGEEARGQLRRGRDGHYQPGGAEAESGNIVQVDDQERQDDPVPEGIGDAARLQEPDRPRKPRIEASERAWEHPCTLDECPEARLDPTFLKIGSEMSKRC